VTPFALVILAISVLLAANRIADTIHRAAERVARAIETCDAD
jgi:hypothetical protein